MILDSNLKPFTASTSHDHHLGVATLLLQNKWHIRVVPPEPFPTLKPVATRSKVGFESPDRYECTPCPYP